MRFPVHTLCLQILRLLLAKPKKEPFGEIIVFFALMLFHSFISTDRDENREITGNAGTAFTYKNQQIEN